MADWDVDLPAMLNELGGSFVHRFERTGELQDITQAISMGSQAVRLTPEGHASLPNTLHNLGNLFLSRFERTNELEDISEVISLHSKVVHMSPEGNPGLDSVIYDLGNSFLRRFKLTGDLQDLAEAISLEYKAVRLTPDGHVNLPSRLNLLGRLFVKRFQRTGDLQDMIQAISRQSEAIRLIPEGHEHLPLFLNDLGHSLMRRFEATDDLQDLSEAVSVQSRALQLTPEGHEYRSSRLNNLASSLSLLAVKKQDLKDLTKAILLYTEALQLFPDGHATRPDVLGNLANGLLFRFEHEGNIQDIIEAGTMYTEAISLTPEGHADLPLRLCNLGYSFHRRFVSSNHPEHLCRSISSYRWAATSSYGCPDIRISAATRWAELADRHPVHSQEVVAAFETAIHLLALIAGLEQTVQRRHSMIQEHTKVPLNAAATAFRLGLPGKALEWLEQGRCLVWGQQDQLRTPLDTLRVANAPLADRLVNVSRQLDSAGSSLRIQNLEMPILEKISHEDAALDQTRLAREWEALLAQVRSISGFETFFQPLPVAALLRSLPISGHVVVINVFNDRCDAIALQSGSDAPLHIPLPLFSLKKAQSYRNALRVQLRCNQLLRRGEGTVGGFDRAIRQYRRSNVEDEGHVHMVLRSLWDELVKPILQVLGLLVSTLLFGTCGQGN
jgi:tetratricopeptide (TPR) repeat protein